MRFCTYCGAKFDDTGSAKGLSDPAYCKVCGATTYARQLSCGPEVLVLTIIFAEDRLLLMRRGMPPYRGCWAPPGGYVEHGESLEAAAAREVREEVGVALSSERLIPFGIISLTGLNQVYVSFITVLDHPVRLDPKLPEALDARWFSESEYPKDEIWTPSRGFDVSRIFERVRTGQIDFYQQSDDSLRVIMSDSRIIYLI